jgi:hypothetical protein
MLRIILGVIAGFFAWAILWFGSEMALSALWPNWFGAQQRAFQAALEHGTPFTAETSFLLTHVVCASIVSVIAGFLAALIAGENKRAPLILGLVLTAFGLLKVVMSWPYVPIWYHLVFTALLLPMTMVGGKLRTVAKRTPESGIH